jgi:hypothetical protein
MQFLSKFVEIVAHPLFRAMQSERPERNSGVTFAFDVDTVVVVHNSFSTEVHLIQINTFNIP